MYSNVQFASQHLVKHGFTSRLKKMWVTQRSPGPSAPTGRTDCGQGMDAAEQGNRGVSGRDGPGGTDGPETYPKKGGVSGPGEPSHQATRPMGWLDRTRLAARVHNAGKFRHGEDKDFAVSHASGTADLNDLANNLFHPVVVGPKLNLNLGQEGKRVFRVTVLVEIAFLPTVPFHFADGQRLDRCPLQAFENLLGQVRLYDGNDLLHGESGKLKQG